MPRVYVLNKGGHDYSSAQRWGELVYCTTGTIPKYNTSQMVRELGAAMEDSTAADYIMLTSLSTLCSIACAMFGTRHGILNLLIFKDDDYVCRRIPLH